MARCDVCGNDYDKSFQVQMQGRTYTFDSFECAVHAQAVADHTESLGPLSRLMAP